MCSACPCARAMPRHLVAQVAAHTLLAFLLSLAVLAGIDRARAGATATRRVVRTPRLRRAVVLFSASPDAAGGSSSAGSYFSVSDQSE